MMTLGASIPKTSHFLTTRILMATPINGANSPARTRRLSRPQLPALQKSTDSDTGESSTTTSRAPTSTFRAATVTFSDGREAHLHIQRISPPLVEVSGDW